MTKRHCFTEGNKRAAVASVAYMLTLNSHPETSNFLRSIENIVVHVADNCINREFLDVLIYSILNAEFDYDEALKLRLFETVYTCPHTDYY